MADSVRHLGYEIPKPQNKTENKKEKKYKKKNHDQDKITNFPNVNN